ncbi:hypothetical protein KFE25_002764 [Diacronema lutheri]|uniref:Calmodulin n=1 Tax=Diacronema lutheri TaxID=2081491 RepID=A0A8J6C8J6_DIALT|nr:hypothetical protein KFE25_002764 [Diacronema lutheri]
MVLRLEAFLGDAAATHGECIVCFEPRSLTLAVLCDDRDQRACRHFLCVDCGNALARKVCPICRAPFERVVQLPSPHRDPRQLFRLIDVSGDGQISKQELAEYCAAFVGVDMGVVSEDIDARWEAWDVDRDGTIDYLEFVSSVCPMLESVYEREHRRARDAAARVPSIWDEPDAWFRHWDADGSGVLDPGELLRALVKTFGGLSAVELSGVLEAIWPLVDASGRGAIDLADFKSPNGLCSLLQANLPGGAPAEQRARAPPPSAPPPRPAHMHRGTPSPDEPRPTHQHGDATRNVRAAPRPLRPSSALARVRDLLAVVPGALTREQVLQLAFALVGVLVGSFLVRAI